MVKKENLQYGTLKRHLTLRRQYTRSVEGIFSSLRYISTNDVLFESKGLEAHIKRSSIQREATIMPPDPESGLEQNDNMMIVEAGRIHWYLRTWNQVNTPTQMLLSQSTFLRKSGDTHICLTSHHCLKRFRTRWHRQRPATVPLFLPQKNWWTNNSELSWTEFAKLKWLWTRTIGLDMIFHH